jgi:hypothetical protein
MKKDTFIIAIIAGASLLFHTDVKAQQETPVKTNLQITADEVGDAVCEMQNKYTAAAWDIFTKTVGTNTSILKNEIIKVFPKNELSDFEYSQDSDDRTNTVKFKVLGLMQIDKNGNWTADLDKKNPDITKVSETTFLLIENGNTLKINLPPGTSGAKITKDSLGEAFITYPANEGGGKGMIFMGLGILVMGVGGFMLYRNMRQPAIRTIYEPASKRREHLTDAKPQIVEEVNIPLQQQPSANHSGNKDYGQY